MRKRKPTPVPALGEGAVARIERGLFAALDARPLEAASPARGRRRGLALALAGVAAAAALFAAREGRRGEAPPVRAAQISTTSSGSRIAIAGATLEVAPHSAVSFGGGRDGAVVVVLDRGTVTCEVAPRSKRAPFVVEAGATRVTVIGTRFSVRRVGEHATVSVEHGLVEVADTDMTELVHAGERYRPGEPVTRDVLASEAEAPPPAAAVVSPPPTGTSAASIPATPAVAVPAGPRGSAAAALAPTHLRRRRLALAGGTAPASADGVTAQPRANTATADATEAPAADAPPPAGPTRAADAPLGAQRRSVQVLFELAAQLEIRDPEAALRIYGELAAGEAPSDGGWAASALFAAARLEAERGQTPRARELCETYLRRFPRGPNADDARTLLAPAR